MSNPEPAEPSQPSDPVDPQLADDRIAKLGALARRGVSILVLRTVVVQLTTLGGGIALARLLAPKDFGIFAITQFALSFFVFFGDAGLGAALIQKKEPPTQRELSSVFFTQLLIATSVILLVAVGSTFMREVWPDLPESSPWLLRALSFEFLLTTLRVLPNILMERELHFGKLAFIELCGNVTFYTTAIALAATGQGVWSFVIAVLGKGAVETTLAYWQRPFVPSLVFDRELLKPILRFGVPFQLNRIVGFVNSALTPLYAGAKLGAGPLGFINWSQSTAYFPLRLVEIFGRIAFPLYSRLQDDKPVLGETLGRTVHLCAAFTAFFVALFFGMGSQLIVVIYGGKWLPALPVLHVYAAAISVGFLAPLVGAVLDSTGRPQVLFRLAICWTALNWIVVPITTPMWGMMGFAVGYCVHVVVGNLVLIGVADRLVPHARLLRRFVVPAIAGCATFLVARLCANWVGSLLTLLPALLLLAATHVVTLLLLGKRGLKEALSLIPTIQHK
jgi:PST family polysaccharide transporter